MGTNGPKHFSQWQACGGLWHLIHVGCDSPHGLTHWVPISQHAGCLMLDTCPMPTLTCNE